MEQQRAEQQQQRDRDGEPKKRQVGQRRIGRGAY